MLSFSGAASTCAWTRFTSNFSTSLHITSAQCHNAQSSSALPSPVSPKSFGTPHLSNENSLIPVIDLFAGPGGLGEGFSAFRDKSTGQYPFKIALSVEKDPYAHQTLLLRSFFRQFREENKVPPIYYEVLKDDVKRKNLLSELAKDEKLSAAWERANQEAIRAELGPDTHEDIRGRIEKALGKTKRPWVLIGGPPCQAYSLAGRVRNKGIKDYTIENDKRSKLYEEYLKIIADHQPAIFVMENVKGLLSATVENSKIFEKIRTDLQCPDGGKTNLRYRIVSVASTDEASKYEEDDPRKFIIRCDKYGVPQYRHRVILVGVRETLGKVLPPPLSESAAPSVHTMIGGLPPLRSGVSPRKTPDAGKPVADSIETWIQSIQSQIGLHHSQYPEWVCDLEESVQDALISAARKLKRPKDNRGDEYIPATHTLNVPENLHEFLFDPDIEGVWNHSTRSHMETDLIRYLFCSSFAKEAKRSPRLEDFPAALLPNHTNAGSGHFNDRFRVQLKNEPSTTITSHISKDGHYFIHYDPTQCRTLTVREAARLQTFPDNYFFCGPRTQQYTQVGNAVPPWIAMQIAESVFAAL